MKVIEAITRISPKDRKRIAKAAGICPDYLYQVGAGIARASATLAVKLDQITHGAISKKEVRPDLFE